jgi:hypothetical protein
MWLIDGNKSYPKDVQRVLEACIALSDEVGVLHRAEDAPPEPAIDLGAHEGEDLVQRAKREARR